MSVCSKFSQLCFSKLLFELVESYHKNKKGELFIETQCINDKFLCEF